MTIFYYSAQDGICPEVFRGFSANQGFQAENFVLNIIFSGNGIFDPQCAAYSKDRIKVVGGIERKRVISASEADFAIFTV